ncbi:MAG: hypothetical protein ACRC6G_10280 [Deefgea sp.]
MAKDVVAHEAHLEALRAIPGMKDAHGAALLTQDAPRLALNQPATLVHEAWCEYEATKRFWDSDLEPQYWDVELRQDVRMYGRQMEYLIAKARQGG